MVFLRVNANPMHSKLGNGESFHRVLFPIKAVMNGSLDLLFVWRPLSVVVHISHPKN